MYPEEITHCAAGVKWFSYLCLRELGKHPNASLLHPNASLSSQNSVNIGEGFLEQPVRCEDGNSIGCLELVKATSGSAKQELVISTFHATVRSYFRGPLKPPFNEEARKAAGFAPEWYEPLALKEQKMAD